MAQLIEIGGDATSRREVENVLSKGSRFDPVSSSTLDVRFKPFTSGSYTFNTNLSNRKMTAADNAFLEVLKAELNGKPPQKDVVLFRGIREKTTLLIGDQVSDRAVMSKSTQMSVSMGFASTGTLMILRYPDMSSHIYLEDISTCPKQFEVISYPGELFEIKAKGKIRSAGNPTLVLDLLYAEYSGNMYSPSREKVKIIEKYEHITSKLDTHLIVVSHGQEVQVFRGMGNQCQKGAPTTPTGLEDFLRHRKTAEVLIIETPKIEDVEYFRFGESKVFQGSVLALVRDYFLNRVERIVIGEIPIITEEYSF